MRALIVSDVHSNLEAFEGVIEDAQKRGGFDEIWSLGDLVGYGPDPGACVDLLRKHKNRSVAGNHDLAAVGRLSLEAFNTYAASAIHWAVAQLKEDHIKYLRDLPIRVETEDFTIVHGSPRDPVWEYVVSVAAATASFLHLGTKRCLVGHSHLPFLCKPQGQSAAFFDFPLDRPFALKNDRIIINPGSVGQPRDGDARASYALYNSKDKSVTHHRVKYDVAVTQKKMKERGLPGYLADRLPHGR
ncbi:MAG: metallophosphoesterase family protein [SAR202 cluster bacterium]|nr:metallophosphoesterase family protein [SAR202 cluster bacterium]